MRCWYLVVMGKIMFYKLVLLFILLFSELEVVIKGS